MNYTNPITGSVLLPIENEEERINQIRLIRSVNIGKINFFRFLDSYGSATKAIEKITQYSFSNKFKQPIIICSKEQVIKEITQCEKISAKLICFTDPSYPRLLREIDDPPPFITILGNEQLLNSNAIAVVGPRNASLNALIFAKQISTDLASHEITVVSGLARGVDKAAHEAAIKHATIGVIGCGIDRIYPAENKILYQQMAKEGLIMSELPLGSLPQSTNFPQRNRIIAGLSMGVVIVEASIKSGTLITANYAARQGRELFVVPGSPFDTRCRGANYLIKQGAKLIENIEDIIEDLPNLKMRFENENFNLDNKKITLKKLPELEQDSSSSINNFPAIDLGTNSNNEVRKIQQEILSKLNFAPLSLEDLAADLKIPIRLLNIALIELELIDKIHMELGKISLK
jgi:DNA processing protein